MFLSLFFLLLCCLTGHPHLHQWNWLLFWRCPRKQNSLTREEHCSEFNRAFATAKARLPRQQLPTMLPHVSRVQLLSSPWAVSSISSHSASLSAKEILPMGEPLVSLRPWKCLQLKFCWAALHLLGANVSPHLSPSLDISIEKILPIKVNSPILSTLFKTMRRLRRYVTAGSFYRFLLWGV